MTATGPIISMPANRVWTTVPIYDFPLSTVIATEFHYCIIFPTKIQQCTDARVLE